MSKLIGSSYNKSFKIVEYVINDLMEISENMKFDYNKRKLFDLKENITQNFNFVIVGKVKSGKSTFLNALIGIKDKNNEVFPTGENITTNKITKIRYGEENSEIVDGIHIITKKYEALKGIELIDTPGTGAIIKEHGKITEEFLHKSNLVIFIFDARNPYLEIEWDLIEKINKNFGKQIIFILQQKDRATEKEIETSIQEIKKQCYKVQLENPIIFTTSAVLEYSNHPNSGFNEVKKYIFEKITGDEKLKIKITSIINTTVNQIKSMKESLYDMIKDLEEYKIYLEEINKYRESSIITLKDQITTSKDSIIKFFENSTIELNEKIQSIINNEKQIKTKSDPIINYTKREFRNNSQDNLKSNFDLIKEDQKRQLENLEKSLFNKKNNINPTEKMDIINMINKQLDFLINEIEKIINYESEQFLKDIKLKDKNILSRLLFFLRKNKVIKNIDDEINKTKKVLNSKLENYISLKINEIDSFLKSKLTSENNDLYSISNKLDKLNSTLSDVINSEVKLKNILEDIK